MPTGCSNQSGLFWREIVIDLFLPKQQGNTDVLWFVGLEAVDADANKNDIALYVKCDLMSL